MTIDAQRIKDPQSVAFARCLWLNAAALAFSLTHAMGDFSLVVVLLPNLYWLHGAFVAFVGALYGWWGWSMAQAGRGAKSGFVGLFVLSLVAVLNGASIVLCPPPCGGTNPYMLWPDASHLGSLIFGGLAAYAAWLVLRANRRKGAVEPIGDPR